MYDFRLFVELPNGKRACAAFRVESEIRTTRCLGPVDVCTDNLTAFIVGGMTVEQALRIRVDREGLVRDIARSLAASIIQVLEEQDTVNGYAKEPAVSKGKQELERQIQQRMDDIGPSGIFENLRKWLALHDQNEPSKDVTETQPDKGKEES